MSRLRLIRPPTVEPVSLDDALHHLRIEHDEDDLFVLMLIRAAREWAENFTGLTLANGVYEWRLAAFYNVLTLPKAPVQSIESIVYYATDSSEQTLDPAVYEFDDDPKAPSVHLVSGQAWPRVSTQVREPVRIRFIGGYDAPGTRPPVHPFPASIQAAILLLTSHLYENRENTSDLDLEEIPMGAKSLLRPYRVRLGMA